MNDGNVFFASGRTLYSRGRNGDTKTSGITVDPGFHSRHESGAIRLMPITSKGRTSSSCSIELPCTRKAVDEIAAMLLQAVIHSECSTLARFLLNVSDARKQAKLPALTFPLRIAEIIYDNPSPYRWRDMIKALQTLTDEARTSLAKAGENAWREVAAQTGGIDKTLLCRLEGAIDELRHAGYSVGAA